VRLGATVCGCSQTRAQARASARRAAGVGQVQGAAGASWGATACSIAPQGRCKAVEHWNSRRGGWALPLVVLRC